MKQDNRDTIAGLQPQLEELPSDQDASGRSLGEEEILQLAAVIASGTLTSTKGICVKQLEERFAAAVGVPHTFGCSSGSAAIHAAVAAIDPEPGEEIVTTAITDMGALTPILYQGAIPVFADVDPQTCNLTASSIERVLSDRTRAILVTHLFGNPSDMGSILALGRKHGLPVIEDCAQAYGATYQGQHVGACGDIGCFSLQQGKHITAGEGGLVTVRDPELARRVFLFINKGWGYGDAQPDHYFLALNYRMNELTGAVALAQLEKLPSLLHRRRSIAEAMSARLALTPGLEPPLTAPGSVSSYWRYCLRVSAAYEPTCVDVLANHLRGCGIACAPRYIQKPAFECAVFRDQRTFGKSRYPFSLARAEAVDYAPERFPGTYAALNRALVLPINENYTMGHADYVVAELQTAVAQLPGSGA